MARNSAPNAEAYCCSLHRQPAFQPERREKISCCDPSSGKTRTTICGSAVKWPQRKPRSAGTGQRFSFVSSGRCAVCCQFGFHIRPSHSRPYDSNPAFYRAHGKLSVHTVRQQLLCGDSGHGYREQGCLCCKARRNNLLIAITAYVTVILVQLLVLPI